MRLPCCLMLLALVLTASSEESRPRKAKGADVAERFVALTFTASDGTKLPYRLLAPEGKDLPLVLCLHGAGGRGDDNLGNVKGCAPAQQLSEPAVQAKHPAILVVPQCPSDQQWVDQDWGKPSVDTAKVPLSNELAAALELVERVAKERGADRTRLYVTGQSMGGWGTWDCLARRPELWAAAMPMCGGGDPARARTFAHVPIWAFHGDKDTVVPTKCSQAMVAALKEAGAANVRYTEYPGVSHICWGRAVAEPDFADWLFAQRTAR